MFLFKKKILFYAFTTCLFFLLILVVSVYFITREYRLRAQEFDLKKINNIELPSIIYDRNQQELGRIFIQNRSPISIDKIPKNIQNALIAGEDQRFKTHSGVDYIGILRAFFLNIKSGKAYSGASTLTMQLARNAYNLKQISEQNKESKYERKIVEIFLARRINKEYNKQQIMEMYLNRVSFGSGFYGIRSAALGYFGKEPAELTIDQCAILIGCIKNPAKISPLRNLKVSQKALVYTKRARDQVLKRMFEENFISAEQLKHYLTQPLTFNPRPFTRKTSYLYQKIINQTSLLVPKELLQQGGLHIYTTIDQKIQNKLRQQIDTQLENIENNPRFTHKKYQSYQHQVNKIPPYLQSLGIIVNRHNGEVLAFIGGRNFQYSQYNFFELGAKPIGTAIFPFIYSIFLQQKEHMVSLFQDQPFDNQKIMLYGNQGILGEWGAETLTPIYEGNITLKHAFAFAKIAATVSKAITIGVPLLAKQLKKQFQLPFPSKKHKQQKYYFNRGIVGTQNVNFKKLLQSYIGLVCENKPPRKLNWITAIKDYQLNQTYYSKTPFSIKKRSEKAAANAFLMRRLLQYTLQQGKLSPLIAQSTLTTNFYGGAYSGHSQKFYNHWFVGHSQQLATLLWTGFIPNNKKSIVPELFPRDTLGLVWANTMAFADKIYHPNQIYKMPKLITHRYICQSSQQLATENCFKYQKTSPNSNKVNYQTTKQLEYFQKPIFPKKLCQQHYKYNLFQLKKATKKSNKAVPSILARNQIIKGDNPYLNNITVKNIVKFPTIIYLKLPNKLTDKRYNVFNLTHPAKATIDIIAPH